MRAARAAGAAGAAGAGGRAAVHTVAGLLAAVAAAGCGAARAGDCARVVSWADYRELEIEAEVVDSFRVRHPEIPVCYESLEGAGIYREKVLTSIAAGTPPELFLLDGIDVPAFVNRGVVLDLAPYVDRLGIELDAFEPRVLETFRRGGGLWALPKGFTPMVVYYNRDLFDAAGVPYPAAGWSWDDFLETARRLTRDTDGDGAADRWGFAWPREFFYLQSWIWAGGGELLSPDGRRASGHLDAPATIDAVRFYLELATIHGVAPRIEMFRRGLGGNARLFYSGRVAMMQSGHWSAKEFRRHEAAGRLRFGVAPLPVRAGVEPVTVLYASGWAVPRNARHRRWAVRLAAFLASETAQRIRMRGELELPSLPAVAAELAAADTTGREAVFLAAVPAGRHPYPRREVARGRGRAPRPARPATAPRRAGRRRRPRAGRPHRPAARAAGGDAVADADYDAAIYLAGARAAGAIGPAALAAADADALRALDQAFPLRVAAGRPGALAPLKDRAEWEVVGAVLVAPRLPAPHRLPRIPLAWGAAAWLATVVGAIALGRGLVAPATPGRPAAGTRAGGPAPAAPAVPGGSAVPGAPTVAGDLATPVGPGVHAAPGRTPTRPAPPAPGAALLRAIPLFVAPALFAAYLLGPATDRVGGAAGGVRPWVVALFGGWAAVAAIGISLARIAGHRLRLREATRAWAFLAPSFAHLLLFSIGPILFSLYLSFHEWNLVEPARPFVGLTNYRELLGDAPFWRAARNTGVYVLFVPAGMALALGLALLVNRRIRGVRLLRTVFFLPYVTSFVAEALALLESQSYLQRNGDVFEFLTDAERDIEAEIKNTDIDEAQVTDLLGKVIFTDVLRDPKIRYEGNDQDYVYARKLDDQLIGKDADVAINIITTDHYHHGNHQTLAMQNVGKAELLAVLPADPRLIEQARLYLKTQKYIQQNSGNGDPTRKAILDQRAQQNSQRRSDIQMLAADLLRTAPLFLNGSRLDTVGEGEARNRFAKACQELISFAFPQLRMLKGAYSETTLHDALLAPDDLLAGTPRAPTEAEQEILTYVMRNQDEGERTLVSEMIRHFGRRPYGWYPMAVVTITGRLFRMGKLELHTGEPLDAKSAFEHLKNSRQHASVRVRLQVGIDAREVDVLRKFHHDFFDRPNNGTDARSVGQLTADALAAEARDLSILLDQAPRYPFLAALRPAAERIARLAEKDHTDLIKHLAEFEDELLTAKEDLIAPIKAFMHGAQRTAYDEALAFLREEEANFAELPAEDVQPLRDLAAAPHPYRGNSVPAAKAAVARLRGTLAELLTRERQQALASLDAQVQQLESSPDFRELGPADRAEVLALSRAAHTAIASARFVAGIRDRLQKFVFVEYPAQLALASKLAAKARVPAGGGAGSPPEPEPIVAYTPAANLKVTCGLPFITNEAELDQWLGALREAARAELRKGNRIIL